MKLKNLEIRLQKVAGFEKPKAEFEQYMTPAPLAARFLFDAFLHGDIEGMKVLDLGCGKGLTSLFLAKEANVNVFATDLWISATEKADELTAVYTEDTVFTANTTLFAVWTFANLGPRAKSLTEKYENEFGEEYKKLNKKHIIPFIW